MATNFRSLQCFVSSACKDWLFSCLTVLSFFFFFPLAVTVCAGPSVSGYDDTSSDNSTANAADSPAASPEPSAAPGPPPAAAGPHVTAGTAGPHIFVSSLFFVSLGRHFSSK